MAGAAEPSGRRSIGAQPGVPVHDAHVGEGRGVRVLSRDPYIPRTLPCWALVAKLQGLYRRDQEQADHSTADDVVGVFYLSRSGSGCTGGLEGVGSGEPGIYALITFWALATASCRSPGR